jgi:hypothetical protein
MPPTDLLLYFRLVLLQEERKSRVAMKFIPLNSVSLQVFYDLIQEFNVTPQVFSDFIQEFRGDRDFIFSSGA